MLGAIHQTARDMWCVNIFNVKESWERRRRDINIEGITKA
jgi:hypothetical protein